MLKKMSFLPDGRRSNLITPDRDEADKVQMMYERMQKQRSRKKSSDNLSLKFNKRRIISPVKIVPEGTQREKLDKTYNDEVSKFF